MTRDSQAQQLALAPELLAEARRLELSMRRVVQGDLIAAYRSAFRGSGLTFADLVEYQPGMELRRINWKASARSHRVYANQFTEERDTTVMILLDKSASMCFGTPRSSAEHGAEIAALLALIARAGGDKVGICTFAGDVIELRAPSNARSASREVIAAAMRGVYHPAGQTSQSNLQNALQAIQPHLRRRALVIIISDLFLAISDHDLRRLNSKHESIVFHLLHSHLRALPDVGIALFHDAESLQVCAVDTSLAPPEAHSNPELTQVAEQLRHAGTEVLTITDMPIRSVAHYLHQRGARRPARRGAVP